MTRTESPEPRGAFYHGIHAQLTSDLRQRLARSFYAIAEMRENTRKTPSQW